ncbi:hypothetical protein A3E46_01160 [Candidatus Woesebacteria bacterium RIFCSPHIGHO2_12_FULL_46_16]|uniref:Uncharacterized protein n=1 Tax=Candidatus Woesebacteria bacterium RIFCSPHIGHO2_12_FULL_46_16 TaxID=1802513 RepID=A0A1F8AYX6_9BACT|nr:MAG: hypothetical protein A3E46_01160 [Candidatus Woesebacteria bacterium RIFCSPHIGHO2_12_FULL_46_16]
MSKTSVLLVRLPGEATLAENSELFGLMKEATGVEVKLAKGANLEQERTRYWLLCERIESIAQNLAGLQGQLEELGEEYLRALALMAEAFASYSPSLRLGATYYAADQVQEHVGGFAEVAQKLGLAGLPDVKKRIRFLRKAASEGGVVVELQNPYRLGAVKESGKWGEKFVKLPVSDQITSVGNGSLVDQTRELVALAVESKKKGLSGHLNFSNTRNDLIPQVLREFVYGANGNDPVQIDIVYSDGSEARPFPLFCLRPLAEEAKARIVTLPEVKVGLLSARHPELDSLVAFYWFRNQEISETRAMAQTDEIAYEKSVQLLRRLKKEGGYRISLYQTGFPPAVVGFYRALVDELAADPDSRPWIEVTPCFFLGGEYVQGAPWC